MERVLGRFGWLAEPLDPAISRSLWILLFVVLGGTAGYTWIEGWDPWHALFFTVVTITTVGFSDYGLSEAGQRFTVLVMVGGIGTVSYAASSLVQRTIAQGLRPEARMLQRIKSLSGHYLVCGFGRMGQRVARQLVASDVPFVVIDSNKKLVEEARELGLMAIEGDAMEDSVLERAGVARAASLAAITSSDAVNAMICLTAHAIAPELRIVARVEDEASVRKMTRAGASRVLSPSSHGADGVAQTLLRPEAARVLYGDGGIDTALAFSELSVSEGSALVGRTIRDVGKSNPRIVFVASCSGEEVSMRPRADRPLREGDVLIVAGTNAEIRELKMGQLKAA